MAEPANWRIVEQVVAAVEQAFAGPHAVVESPIRLPDRHTGQLREIDVGLRFRQGTVDCLVTFECRDHRDPQDVTWIEQAASKRDSVGAHKTILVSTSGYTEPARRKAAQLGIEARTLAELGSDQIREWCVCRVIVASHITWSPARLCVNLRSRDGQMGAVEMDPSFVAAYAADNLHAPICFVMPDRFPITVTTVVAQLEARGESLMTPEQLFCGAQLSRLIRVEFEPGQCVAPCVFGEMEVRSVDLGVSLKVEVSENAMDGAGFREIRRDGELLAGIARGNATTPHVQIGFDLVYGPAAPGGWLLLRDIRMSSNRRTGPAPE